MIQKISEVYHDLFVVIFCPHIKYIRYAQYMDIKFN